VAELGFETPGNQEAWMPPFPLFLVPLFLVVICSILFTAAVGLAIEKISQAI
jgi:hypothetical protein